MSSDLAAKTIEEPAPKKARGQILRSEISEGMDAMERPAFGLFVSGLSAGLDVGFSVLLMAVMRTLTDGRLSAPVSAILMANMYAIGFIFVVVGRSELFTEQTTLAVLPVLSGQTSLLSLLRLWGIVYVANLIGATCMALLIALIAPLLGAAEPKAFGFIAGRLVAFDSRTILLSGILAGWLMGLLSWLVAASRDTISQIVFVWLITTCIGLIGLHHVVLGTVEVLAGVFAHQAITPAEFGRFLIWATLGNIVGGSFFVALVKYGHSRPESQ